MKLTKLVHIIAMPVIALTATGSAIALSSCTTNHNNDNPLKPNKKTDKPTSLKIVKPSYIPSSIYVDKRINIDGFLYNTLPADANKSIWVDVDNHEVAHLASFYTLSIKPNKIGKLDLTIRAQNKKYQDVFDEVHLSFNVIDNPKPEPKKPEHIVKQFPAECIGGHSGSFSLDFWEDKLNECTLVDCSKFGAIDLHFNNTGEFMYDGKTYKITKIADDAFNGHIKTTDISGTVIIPKEIKEIGNRIFNRNSICEVKFLTNDMSQLTFGEQTFANCPFIRNIDVSKSKDGVCYLKDMFDFTQVNSIKVPSSNFDRWKYSNYGVSHKMVAIEEN